MDEMMKDMAVVIATIKACTNHLEDVTPELSRLGLFYQLRQIKEFCSMMRESLPMEYCVSDNQPNT